MRVAIGGEARFDLPGLDGFEVCRRLKANPELREIAVIMVSARGEEVDVLAGGQSLVPLLNMRQRRPGIVLDITRLPGLDGIRREEDACCDSALC